MICVTYETQSHINKQPGFGDVATASVVLVLLMATERNRRGAPPEPAAAAESWVVFCLNVNRYVGSYQKVHEKSISTSNEEGRIDP
ncbi:eukaryotic initiation factor 4A-II [Prionailurus iriomotensis]